MSDIDEDEPVLQYSVMIYESNGYSSDSPGDFNNYQDAYNAFEKAVRLIDGIDSNIDNYSLVLDLVQLIDNDKLLISWQRPPWRTEALLKKWAKSQGYGEANITPYRFVHIEHEPQ